MKCNYIEGPHNYVEFLLTGFFKDSTRPEDESTKIVKVLKRNWSEGLSIIGGALSTQEVQRSNIVWNITHKTRIKDRYTNTDLALTQAEIDVEKAKIK